MRRGIVTLVLAALMAGALYAGLVRAPRERVEGDVQRIMYAHVPAAQATYLSYTIVFVGSVMYLLRRDPKWDVLAASAAEVGTLFATAVLVTGAIWGRQSWGTYWAWDARLTLFFILSLIYVAYLMLRRFGGSPDAVARYCAVLGVLGFVDIPLTHYAVEWWRTLHPKAKLMTQGSIGGGMPQEMLAALALGALAALAATGVMIELRVRVERVERRVQALQARRRA